jgi:DNA-binding transcriptional ArsR family regulator
VRLLESAGLLEQSKDGRRRLYRVNRDKLALIRTWLQWFFEDAAGAT